MTALEAPLRDANRRSIDWPAAHSRYDRAAELAKSLATQLDLGVVPTIDGRVLVFAPRHRGDTVRAEVEKLLVDEHTVRVHYDQDPRLAVIEVSP